MADDEITRQDRRPREHYPPEAHRRPSRDGRPPESTSLDPGDIDRLVARRTERGGGPTDAHTNEADQPGRGAAGNQEGTAREPDLRADLAAVATAQRMVEEDLARLTARLRRLEAALNARRDESD